MTKPDIGGRVAHTAATGLVVVRDDEVCWLNETARALVEPFGGSWTGPGSPLPALDGTPHGTRRAVVHWTSPAGGARRWLVSATAMADGTGLLHEIVDRTGHDGVDGDPADTPGQGSWVMDVTNGVVHFSDALTEMLGVGPVATLEEAPYRVRFRPEERAKVRGAVRAAIDVGGSFHTVSRVFADPEHRDERLIEWRGDTYPDATGVVTHVMGTVRDVSDRPRERADLAYFAGHDPLTGVANRQRVSVWLAECAAGTHGGALLLFDVDDFSDVNDLCGPVAGDRVLRHVVRTVADVLGPDARLGRVGGDEFAVLLPRATVADGTALAERLRRAVVENPATDPAWPVTISLGVTAVEPGRDPDAGLARADLALDAAKAAGRNRVRPFTEEQYRAAEWRVSLLRRVGAALEAGTTSLDAQPIVDLATGRTLRHEALIRLRDGRSPDVGPAEFLPLAERTDLVLEIDRWVLDRVVDALATPAARAAGLCLEANVSARSLEDDGFAARVLDLLAARDVEPARLGLEITETAAVASLDAARALAERLTAAGCGVALDDFGTGHCSLTYLKTLPLRTVKIAGDFVRNLDRDPVDRALVQSVVSVAHLLGMRTVAEQVSHEGLIEPLLALGVDDVQGYHLGRPVPLDSLLASIPAVSPG